MENVGVFYCHLEYLKANWYTNYMAFLYFSGLLVYFPRFGRLYHEKSGNPVVHVNERVRDTYIRAIK
jgi:hypothetical protein